ncbi:alpha/beta hydrolase [Paenibacillus qinlingensis]|uniref:Pimeloyl-ACP methyl ester carboxylesterase n=1 Tax=Paenibacillus qinlingensis TaxID=1837343 RepID=A0ABU1P359_9BACL|nr:alpha/beta hydrolase [Paenibacillus qinlingensis]MDR6553507.1 pimeloyl-ACP methyl ester carboxylesterase [Paenibacillus qinlingensis]
MVHYQKMKIDGWDLFFRQAGSRNNPTIILLHGFPSSSHMFRDLIPLLTDRFHVIAPDYLGFGNSSMPSVEEYSYTFENLSFLIEKLIDNLCISRFILYCQDYGGPIGFRLAVRNPHRILGFVIQNAVASENGLGKPFDTFKALWADRNPATEAAFTMLTTFEFTKMQYLKGACQPCLISPDGYLMDQLFLDRPGNSQIQLALGYDYRTNVEQYPVWQQYLRTYQPPTLITWGKNDFNFTLEGALTFGELLKCAEIHFLCGGHFLLEEQSQQVAALIKLYFGHIYTWGSIT